MPECNHHLCPSLGTGVTCTIPAHQTSYNPINNGTYQRGRVPVEDPYAHVSARLAFLQQQDILRPMRPSPYVSSYRQQIQQQAGQDQDAVEEVAPRAPGIAQPVGERVKKWLEGVEDGTLEGGEARHAKKRRSTGKDEKKSKK